MEAIRKNKVRLYWIVGIAAFTIFPSFMIPQGLAQEAPIVLSASPEYGPVSGGRSVIITGSHFTDGYTVTFGGTEASGYQFYSSTEIGCKNPSGSLGAVDVVVTNPGGLSGVLDDGYLYLDKMVLDVDGNGKVTPLGDGVIIVRLLLGYRGNTLIDGALDPVNCTRCTPQDILDYLMSIPGVVFDIDGEGKLTPLGEIVILVRWLFGFKGVTLTQGCISIPECKRCLPDQVEAFLREITP